MVIFSEMAGNESQSVTNAAEVIAGEILTRHGLTDGTAPVFIEHYPPETEPIRQPESFDLVTFASPLRYKRVWGGPEGWMPLLGEPDWKPLYRPQVERLVGAEL